MKNKRDINLNDKMKYLKFNFRTRWHVFVLTLYFSIFTTFAIIAIISSINKMKNLKEISNIYYILFYVLSVLIIFLTRKPFRVLFFKNIYVTDGHIFKKHIFISHPSSSDGAITHESKARAISEDGGISTKWITFSKKYFREKEIPVKIVIYKNKAIDFYVEDYKMLKK